MLWTDKYRPQELSQVVGNTKEIKIIKDWVSAWKSNDPQIPLLLVGPPGIGKTTLAQIIAKQFSEHIELNASDKRSQDVIKSTIGESSSSRSLFGDEYKLIILDEVDGIHGTNDRGGVRAIGEIIKNSNHPMILIANDFYSKRLQSIKPKCQVIKMKKSRWNSISKLLREIAEAEGVEANPAALKEIAVKSQGDVRSAINTLQALSSKDSTLEVKDVENMKTKDTRSDIFNAITGVLKSKTPAHVKEAMWIEEDPTLVMEYIAENIPREYKKKDEIKKAYDYISKADIFFGRTLSSRNYGYWKYASDFMGIGVSNSKHETYKKFTKIQTPTIFSLMGRNRGKRNLRDAITEKISERIHISRAESVAMFPYLEIMFKNDELAWEISDYFEFEDTEIKRFRSKKIPKKVITKMEKQQAQMRVEERDRRAEELKSQMMNVAAEAEEKSERDLPFEIPGIDSTKIKEEIKPEEPEKEEIVLEEPAIEESIPEPEKEEPKKVEKKPKKKKEKKKTDKQVSLFSF